jgi:hypothetical protein
MMVDQLDRDFRKALAQAVAILIAMGSGKVKRIRTLAMQFCESGGLPLGIALFGSVLYRLGQPRANGAKGKVCAQFHLACCRRVG